MNQFTFTPQFADYWRLNRYVFLKTMRRLLWICAALVVVFVLFPLAMTRTANPSSISDAYVRALPVLFLPGFVALMFAMTFYGARKRWQKASELRSAVHYNIGEDGVRTRTEGVEAFIAWNHIASAELHHEWFYLKTNQNVFFYFPVEVVPDKRATEAMIVGKVVQTRGMTEA